MAQVYLEKRFDSADAALAQSGFAEPSADPSKVVYYDGGSFPFNDKEFDYVVCSHVLEHVEDVESFVAEIIRVGRAGYLEFPTIYYDYIYDFPEHVTLLLQRDGAIAWMPKRESGLARFQTVTKFFYRSLQKGHVEMIEALKPYLFQGFEWFGRVELRRVDSLDALTYDVAKLEISPPTPAPQRSLVRRALGRLRRQLGV
jgi:SAM-dependent methyltransferase